MINRIIDDSPVAIYGIGVDTKYFLEIKGQKLKIVGLLDGYQQTGYIYGYPIITLEQALALGIKSIIVIARAASRRIIVDRIKKECKNNNVGLLDVNGNDLLKPEKILYNFKKIEADSMHQLRCLINKSTVVSFDLFDTLIMRKVPDYCDLFEIMGNVLKQRGVDIPNFACARYEAELSLSIHFSPTLENIYEEVLKRVGKCKYSADDLAEIECTLDSSLLIPRKTMCKLFRETVLSGKKVIITTDSYYHEHTISKLLKMLSLEGYERLFISCEYGVTKKDGLFEYVIMNYKCPPENILHIGDNPISDIQRAQNYNINSFRLQSGNDLFDYLGGLGIRRYIVNITDKVKTGLLISKWFNDPFIFEKNNGDLVISDPFDVGYLFFAPVITDFIFWLNKRLNDYNINEILFSSRDGYLINKLFLKLNCEKKSHYFLTSRIAAIRSCLEDENDINKIDKITYSGTDKQKDITRFGLDVSDLTDIQDKYKVILEHSKQLRDNYLKYIHTFDFSEGDIALYDFVARGTVQLYLQRLFKQHIKGLYFMHLDENFSDESTLDIESFFPYEDIEKNVFFELYQIMETLFMAPHPSINEFDVNGNPIFSEEKRSSIELKCISQVQQGVLTYFDDFLSIIDIQLYTENRDIDEILGSLINSVVIDNEVMAQMNYEDNFFGRKN